MSVADVKKLHSKWAMYSECECWQKHKDSDDPEEDSSTTLVFADDVGWVCAEGPHVKYICRECDLEYNEPTEFSEYGKWPCDTLIALNK